MRPAPRLSSLALAASLLTLFACDEGKAPAPKAEADQAKAKSEGGEAAKPEGDKPEADNADTKKAADAVAGGDAKAAELHPDDAQLADKRKGDELDHDAGHAKQTHDKMLALLTEARKQAEAGDAKAAIPTYEQLLAIDPHYRPALIELGAVEAKAENWAAAVHHLKLAAKLTDNSDPLKAKLFDDIGQYTDKEGKKDDAAHYYRESLKLAENAEVQGRLDALGDVAPEPAAPPPGPPDSVDGLNLRGPVVGSAQDVCANYGQDGLCVPKECNFITSGSDDSWGVFEVGDGTTNCYHPAVRVGDDNWAVYASAMMDSHGEEVHQGVDRLELEVVEAEGGPFLVIHYADHLYERVWDEDLGKDEIPPEDTIDTEGMIVCQRVDDKTRCTAPIITSVDFAIGVATGKFSAKVELGPDKVVVSDVTKQGKPEAAVRTYFYGVLLEPGPHTLPAAM